MNCYPTTMDATHKFVVSIVGLPFLMGFIGQRDSDQYIAWRLNFSLYAERGETPEQALDNLIRERYPECADMHIEIREIGA